MRKLSSLQLVLLLLQLKGVLPVVEVVLDYTKPWPGAGKSPAATALNSADVNVGQELVQEPVPRAHLIY